MVDGPEIPSLSGVPSLRRLSGELATLWLAFTTVTETGREDNRVRSTGFAVVDLAEKSGDEQAESEEDDVEIKELLEDVIEEGEVGGLGSSDS